VGQKDHKKPRAGRPHTHFDAEALKRFRDGVQRSLAHIRTDARTALENSNSQKSENLSPRSMLRFLREDLDVPRTLVRDGDALELLKLADVDDYGTLALDDLAAFVEKGPKAFYNAQALPGKSVQLPKPPGADSQRFGRVVGALEARLENGDTRKRFAAVDHDGDGKVKVEAFREAVRGSSLNLTEDDLEEEDLDALVQMIDKNPGGRKVYEVDVRKLALLSKRGGDAVADLYDAEKQFLRKTADERKKAIQRRTAEDRYTAWDAAQPKPDPRQKIPPLGQRLIPCNLFAWLDDPVGYVAPMDAPNLSSKDDSTGPSDLEALIKLRNALQLHEALGQSLAAGSVLLKMGRRLRDRSLARYFPRGAHRAKELRCAGEALDAASSLFRTYFDDATHHLSLTALYEAADAFLEAEDELVNSLSKQRGPVPDDLEDDAASERSLLLRFAERSLAEFKEAHSLLDVTGLTPKEIARYANGLTLVAVVQSRQPLHEGPAKVKRSFGDAERLHAALQGDVAALCKAEFQKRRAFERSRAGYPAEALEAMRAREELLESALGVDHVETVGARRLRVLWSRGLGAGAGIGGNAPA